MTSEDQAMLARISEIAGQINRHKNQQAGIMSVPSSSSSYASHRNSPGLPYQTPYQTPYAPPYHRTPYAPRGGGGGYRVGKPAPHRNRTLVLNGATTSTTPTTSIATTPATTTGTATPGIATSTPTSNNKTDGRPSAANGSDAHPASAWVAKRDRHMQLINVSVYEKEAQARTKAIEQTRLQRQKLKDQRERDKLHNHFQYLAGGVRHGVDHPVAATTAAATSAAPYTVVVQGIPFSVAKNGSKLVKLPGDPNPPSSTPKTAVVGGVKFYRSKTGNLYRHGVVKAHRYAVPYSRTPGGGFGDLSGCGGSGGGGVGIPLTFDIIRRDGAVKKIDQPCKIFSTTGSCSKGRQCRYIHDAAKVAVCKDYLQKGECRRGENCDLSHDLTPQRTPLCLHFAKGNCTNAQCPYSHQEKVSPGAPVCRPFGLYGYCDQGADCPERHVFECPDFSNTGICKTKGCKLPHRDRASLMRRGDNSNKSGGGVDGDGDDDSYLVDASSDESVNSDDVDSDEIDEFVGAKGEDADDANRDIVSQKDYIEF